MRIEQSNYARVMETCQSESFYRQKYFDKLKAIQIYKLCEKKPQRIIIFNNVTGERPANLLKMTLLLSKI